MNKIAKAHPMALVLSTLFLFGAAAQAQSTYTAASCNYSDVNAVINGPIHTAMAGDTINVPAGSCTWSSELVISEPINFAGLGCNPNQGAGTTGAGTTGVTLTDNQTVTSLPMIDFNGMNTSALTTMSCFTVEPNSSSTPLGSPIWIGGSCTSSACPNMRFDNLIFNGWSESGNGTASSWMVLVWNMFGVFDHNTLSNSSAQAPLLANANLPSYLNVGQYGDNSWAQPDTYGTASALYFENNLFENGAFPYDTDNADTYTDIGGGRVVARFNTATGQAGSFGYVHGTETTDRPRGGRQQEVYANTITCGSGKNCFALADTARSGTALVWGNIMATSGGGSITSLIAPLVIRTYRGPSTPWGNCDGSGGYDDNDGTVYVSGTITSVGGGQLSVTDSSKSWSTNQWAGSAVTNGDPYSVHDVTQGFGDEIASNTSNTITFTGAPLANSNSPQNFNVGDSYEILRASVCIDQPGRGVGSYIFGNTPPTGWVLEALDPIYEFDDSVSGTFYNLVVNPNGTAKVIANRDWYNESENQPAQSSPTIPFNGSGGTGHGTLANRPTTCTKGVAFWAYDQGNWNSSGNTYAAGYSQGELFVCTATNTWTLFYTPYTYPHPLTANSSDPPPAAPTGLTAVVQ